VKGLANLYVLLDQYRVQDFRIAGKVRALFKVTSLQEGAGRKGHSCRAE
jgi:hypothetical protein